MICESCHKEKPDVRERIDPYSAEINDKEILVILCDDCTQERVDDI